MIMILNLTTNRNYNSLFSLTSIPFLRIHKAGGALLKMNDPQDYVERLSKGLKIADGYTIFKDFTDIVSNERCYSGRNINEVIEIDPKDGFPIPLRLVFTYLENKQ